MKKLKLTNLSESTLSSDEMNNLNGGRGCGCGCFYEGNGGSSTDANGSANNKTESFSDATKGMVDVYVTPDN